MTDAELIELLENKVPAEFTPDEVELLRARLTTSSVVRQALQDRLLLDQSLTQVLGQIHLAPETILARQQQQSPTSRPGIRWGLLGVALLLVGLTGWGLQLWLWPAGELAIVQPVSELHPLDPTHPKNVANEPGTTVKPSVTQQPKSTIGTKISVNSPLGAIIVQGNSFTQGKNIATAKEGPLNYIKAIDPRLSTEVEYEFTIPTAGEYILGLQYRSITPQPLPLSIDGEELRRWSLRSWPRLATDSTQNWSYYSRKLELTAGKHRLRLQGEIPRSSRYQNFPDLQRLTLIPKEQLAKDKAIADPWQSALYLDAPPRTFLDLAREPVAEWGPVFSSIDVRNWFQVQDGIRIESQYVDRQKFPSITGRTVLRTPLDPEHLLRLALSNNAGIQINCWSGLQGYSLRYYPGDNKAWAAYRIERNRLTDYQIQQIDFVSSDQDRFARSLSEQNQLRLELRCTTDQLMLSYVGIPLLTVPWQGDAPDVEIDFKHILYGLGLQRVSDGPPSELLTTPPIATTWERPAEREWQVHQGAAASWQTTPEGAVEFRSTQQPTQIAWATADLQLTGPSLIDCQLQVPAAGGRLILATAENIPRYAIAAIRDRKTKRVMWKHCSPQESFDEDESQTLDRCSPVTGDEAWIRIVQGAGVVRIWISTDGQTWGRALTPIFDTDGGCERIGLLLPAGNLPRQMILHKVAIRPITALQELVPAAARELHPPVKSVADHTAWTQHTANTRPANVSAADWQAAASWRAITLGQQRTVAHAELLRLLEAKLFPLPMNCPEQELQSRLQLLAAASWIAHTQHGTNDYPVEQRFVRLYLRLADALSAQGQSNVWSRIWPHYVQSPCWTSQAHQEDWSALARTEIFETLYANQPQKLRQLNYWTSVLYPQLQLESWLDNWLISNYPVAESKPLNDQIKRTKEFSRTDRRHPLIEEINKESYNTMAELNSAIGSKAWRDACQIITQVGLTEVTGLLPDQQDPLLLLALPTATQLALQQEPELQQLLIQEFDALGNLRFRKAELQADATTMHALTIQYPGTSAAARANYWLGERALTNGQFARAEQYFLQAQANLPAEQLPQLAAKLRLTTAYRGQSIGPAVQIPVQLGATLIAANDFEQTVQELLQQHVAAESTTANPTVLPELKQLHWQATGQVDGNFGDRPQDFPEQLNQILKSNRPLDWAGRTSQLHLLGDRVLFTNRFQATCYARNSGKRIWQVSLDQNQGRTHDWIQTPMRPLVQHETIYLRRLTRTGPELIAVSATGGKLLWQSRADLIVIADPLWSPTGLQVLTLVRGEQDAQVQLATLDPTSGTIIGQRTLCNVRSSWDEHHTAQWVQHGDHYYGVLTGLAFCCDSQGRMCWIRKQIWFSPREDREWLRQAMQPPLLEQDRLVITQPGVKALECLDLTTGRLLWRQVLPTLERMLGSSAGQVLVQTNQGLIAIDIQTGLKRWSYEQPQLLEAYALASKQSQLWVWSKQEQKKGVWSPQLIQLDTQTGQVVTERALTEITGETVLLGPMLSLGDGAWWVLAGSGHDKPQRTILEIRPK